MKVITKIVTDDDSYINNCEGEIKNNKLTFIENGVKVIIDLEKAKLTRDSEDAKMECTFVLNDEGKYKLYMKELDKYLDILIFTRILVIEEGFIDIEYKLLDNNSVVRYIINYGG